MSKACIESISGLYNYYNICSKLEQHLGAFLTITYEQRQTRLDSEGINGSSTSGLHDNKNYVIRYSIDGDMDTLI